MAETETKNKKTKQEKKTAKHAAPVEKKTGSIVRNVLLTVIFVLIAGIAAVIVYANTYDGIFPNTYVEDHNVSGLTENEVVSLLSEIYNNDNLKDSSLTLICKDKTSEIALNDLDIKFDNVALTQKVINSGREGNPLDTAIAFVSRLFNEYRVEPEADFNTEKLLSAVDETVVAYETEPVGHTFEIGESSVKIYGPVNGLKVNRNKVIEEFKRQLALMRFSIIDMVPESAAPEKLNFDEFYKWLTSDTQDAYYEKIDGVVQVHPSKPRCEVSEEAVKAAVSSIKTSEDNTAVVDATVIQPENTAEVMTSLLYRDELSQYSTNFGGSSASRANNVRLAISRINGTELMPGEELSYDKTILPRTAANGYQSAGVYVGNKVETGMGGGICQPSSTLYAASLYANLEIVERHNHSLPVSYIPLGMDATIAEGVLDLKIRNNTNYPIKIVATGDNGVACFKILGTNIDNTSVAIERTSGGGSYYVTRVVKKNGEVVNREKMSSSTYGTPEKSDN